jgi:hypothetical protein
VQEDWHDVRTGKPVMIRTQAKASWIDPRTGESVPAGSFPNSGVQAFSTPEGWEDALLVLEPSKG